MASILREMKSMGRPWEREPSCSLKGKNPLLALADSFFLFPLRLQCSQSDCRYPWSMTHFRCLSTLCCIHLVSVLFIIRWWPNHPKHKLGPWQQSTLDNVAPISMPCPSAGKHCPASGVHYSLAFLSIEFYFTQLYPKMYILNSSCF